MTDFTALCRARKREHVARTPPLYGTRTLKVKQWPCVYGYSFGPGSQGHRGDSHGARGLLLLLLLLLLGERGLLEPDVKFRLPFVFGPTGRAGIERGNGSFDAAHLHADG